MLGADLFLLGLAQKHPTTVCKWNLCTLQEDIQRISPLNEMKGNVAVQSPSSPIPPQQRE